MNITQVSPKYSGNGPELEVRMELNSGTLLCQESGKDFEREATHMVGSFEREAARGNILYRTVFIYVIRAIRHRRLLHAYGDDRDIDAMCSLGMLSECSRNSRVVIASTIFLICTSVVSPSSEAPQDIQIM
jgi:hypothetical protein